jgi:hypothetical protein
VADETGNWINKDLIFLKLIKFLSKFQVSSFEFHYPIKITAPQEPLFPVIVSDEA